MNREDDMKYRLDELRLMLDNGIPDGGRLWGIRPDNKAICLCLLAIAERLELIVDSTPV